LHFATIIPPNSIVVPDASPVFDIPRLTEDALANQPILAQTGVAATSGRDVSEGISK